MNAKAETQTILMEFDLPHPPSKVWRALTEPELLGKWLMPTDMQPVVGKSFTFKTQPSPQWDGTVSCEVKEIELHKRLQFTWGGGGIDTMVTWILAPTAKGGTLLRIEHSGFPTGKSEARFFEGAKMGWQFMAGKRLPELLGEIR